MVRRGKVDDGSVAVLEPGDATAIAARVAAATAEQRRDEVRADVLRYREIVAAIAAGREPSADDIRDIGAIGTRLRLPADSIATGVAAIKRAEELDATAQRLRAEVVEVQARKPQLLADIKAAEQRLNDLQAQLHLAILSQSGMAETLSAASHHRNQHPTLWGDVDHVVGLMCRHDAALGHGTLDALKHRPPFVPGQSVSNWS